MEFCWNCGANENLLDDTSKSGQDVKNAMAFLQYLVNTRLMSPKPTLRDAEHSLFSRQWYSGLSQLTSSKCTRPPDLLALPFFPLVSVRDRPSAIDQAFTDNCRRVARLCTRIRATLLYRGNNDYEKTLKKIEREIEILCTKTNITEATVNDLCKHVEEIRRISLDALQLRRGYRVDRRIGDRYLQASSDLELRKSLPVARSLNIRDILELLRWHEFRVAAIKAELSGISLSQVVEFDKRDELNKVGGNGSAAASISALMGYCCSGSWMLGAGRDTHSPVLSWKLIDEITSLEETVRRAGAGAGIPVRKDFYDAHGKESVQHVEHLDWNRLLRYGECRVRRRDRIADDKRRLKDKFQILHLGLRDCLTVAAAARSTDEVAAAAAHAEATVRDFLSAEGSQPT